MANGRNGGKRRRDTGREAGGFVALPLSVLQSAAYLRLSHPARSLLLEVALQFHGDDNGRMLLSGKHLAARGWKSADVIHRAKQELLDAQLIFETVKGQRPNKASWYAVTWRALDRHPGHDSHVATTFERGAYQNASLIPSGGAESTRIAPSRGVRTPAATPSDGAMRGVAGGSLTPSHGNPLDLCHLQHRAADAAPAREPARSTVLRSTLAAVETAGAAEAHST